MSNIGWESHWGVTDSHGCMKVSVMRLCVVIYRSMMMGSKLSCYPHAAQKIYISMWDILLNNYEILMSLTNGPSSLVDNW